MHGSNTQRAGILALVVIAFEFFFSRSVQLFGIRPDLFLIFIVFWSFAIDRRSALFVAILLGLIRDLFASGFFGAETLGYFLAAGLTFIVSLKIDRQNFLMKGAACFVFSLVHFWVYALVTMALTGGGISGNFWWLSILHSLTTAILAAWLIGFFERICYPRSSHISFNT
ncbi:MAG: rod shape-determining protein MreD [Candidatus Omnitrophica bacterium]|nr:rod shape-determining protein MreD [Candidatus Omnitrophota bacterium]